MRALTPCAIVGAIVGLALGTSTCVISTRPTRELRPGGDEPVDLGDESCASIPVPRDPALLGLDDGTITSIAAAARDGAVVVQYFAVGCSVRLRVLEDCRPRGQYHYTPAPRETQEVVRSTAQLLERLPLANRPVAQALRRAGAVRLHLRRAGRLERTAEGGLPGLRDPTCEGATHLVRAIDLGAAILAEGESPIEEDGDRILAQLGKLDTCAGARGARRPPSGCDAPLRVELVPLLGPEVAGAGETHGPRGDRAERPDAGAGEGEGGSEGNEAQDAGLPAAGGRAEPVPEAVEPAGEDMIAVPAGDFWMGADGPDRSQAPRHRVTLDAFRIDRTEVTAAAYARCVADRVCMPARIGEACTANRPDKARHPINCVSFAQARAFCAYRKRRLPTEAEWERAARGTDARAFVWGNDWPPPPRVGNFGDETARQVHVSWLAISEYDDGFPDTAPVGTFPAGRSPVGALDMAGNVAEWTADRYDEHYYDKAPARNPKGPSAGFGRVVRGSTFGHHRKAQFFVTARVGYREDVTSAHIGFRCAE